MAEYTEVMKQYARMCEMLRPCGQCPLSARNNESAVCCTTYMQECPAKSERIIMDWAAAHPEPHWPTWREWQNKLFPDNSRAICKAEYMKRYNDCHGVCDNCGNTPIPPDIAAKLGIDPVRFWEQETEGGDKNATSRP